MLILSQEVQTIDFRIKAETSYGVSVTSDLIMIDIIDNCLHDNITLNSTPRVDNDLVEYSTIDGYPILKINEDIQNYTLAGSKIKVNLTEQFL